MDEELQKDIIKVFQKHQRFDLISLVLNMIEEIDSDYEPEEDEEEEPREEYFEGRSIPEDPSFSISHDGFHYLN